MTAVSIRNAWRYAFYYLTAGNGKGHGIHSPFVFDFIIHLLNDTRQFYAYAEIEKKYASLSGDALRHIVLPQKCRQLLFRMVDYYHCKTMLDATGSSGIIADYLAAACGSSGLVISVTEGMPTAKSPLPSNTGFVAANGFDKALRILADRKLDVCVINPDWSGLPGNWLEQMMPLIHTETIIAVTGIHGSPQARAIWKDITERKEVTLTINVFHMGLVFFREQNKVKQHFSIRY